MGQSTTQVRPDGSQSLAGVPGSSGPILVTLAVAIAILSAVFFPEFRAAVEVWNASTAYGHCYLILPMTAYLLWDRRDVIARVMPRPEPGWAVLGLPIAAMWLGAERLGIMEGRQLAAIAGFELLFLVVLGRRLFWQLSGPLLYLVFLVPFGAFLTSALQQFTAKFSIVGLNLLGIPNYSDNFIIETPAGIFFVAEACAGLRFLIAAVAFGVFYALLNFRSPWRRVAFVAASILIPIIANGFRALGIVVLGQVLGSAEAAAADHIVYGWVFFSIVMLLLVAAGHPFRQLSDDRPASVPIVRLPTGRSPVWGAASAILLLGIGPAVAAVIDGNARAVPLLAMPVFQVPPGCAPAVSETALSSTARQSSMRCGDTVFDIVVTVFPGRSTSSAIVAERRRVTQEIGAEDVTITPMDGIESGAWMLVQTTDPNRLTAVASWVDGKPVRSSLAGRVAQARDSVLGATNAPVLVTISTPEMPRVLPQQRRATLSLLRAFVSAQQDLGAELRPITLLTPSTPQTKS